MYIIVFVYHVVTPVDEYSQINKIVKVYTTLSLLHFPVMQALFFCQLKLGYCCPVLASLYP